MSPQELEAISNRAAAATSGPWVATAGTEDAADVFQHRPDMGPSEDDWPIVAECGGRQPMWSAHHNDAAFIAAARTDVPALVARVRELEAERDALRALLAVYDHAYRTDNHVPMDITAQAWRALNPPGGARLNLAAGSSTQGTEPKP